MPAAVVRAGDVVADDGGEERGTGSTELRPRNVPSSGEGVPQDYLRHGRGDDAEEVERVGAVESVGEVACVAFDLLLRRGLGSSSRPLHLRGNARTEFLKTISEGPWSLDPGSLGTGTRDHPLRRFPHGELAVDKSTSEMVGRQDLGDGHEPRGLGDGHERDGQHETRAVRRAGHRDLRGREGLGRHGKRRRFGRERREAGGVGEGQVLRAVRPGGHVIVATFGPHGPERCSGLDVVRYDDRSLHAEFGGRFEKIDSGQEIHATPWGSEQEFFYCYCVRKA